MSNLMIYSVIVLLAMLILLYSIDMSKIAGYAIYVDIGLTLMLPILLKETFSGLMTAAMTGLMLSIFLHTYRYFKGYKKFNLRYRTWVYYPHKSQEALIDYNLKINKGVQ